MEPPVTPPETPSGPALKRINALMALIETLRGENGCPWDRQQTPESMINYLMEEVYELADAIASGEPEQVCEEMGDVLFHILFLARLYTEAGLFDIDDVAAVNTRKMIRRHPHVFGSDTVSGTDEIRERWIEIKRAEKAHAPRASVLDAVPVKLPALMRAYRISERAAGLGFDWRNISGVIQKVEEEWAELDTALEEGDPARHPDIKERVTEEFGDVLFTLVNLARFLRIHPETALTGAVKKFESRFRRIEKPISRGIQEKTPLSPEEMDRLWTAAKY